jgi:hypothetical protein
MSPSGISAVLTADPLLPVFAGKQTCQAPVVTSAKSSTRRLVRNASGRLLALEWHLEPSLSVKMGFPDATLMMQFER